MTRRAPQFLLCLLLGALASPHISLAPGSRVALTWGASVVAAQSPPPQPKKVEGTFGLSFINRTGNTDITTIGYDEIFIARPGWQWTITQNSGIIYGTNDGEVLAESYRASAKVDLAFSAFIGAYTSLSFDRNVFADRAARYTFGTGLSAILVDVEFDKAKAELGLARVSERNTANVIARSFAAQLVGEYKHLFGPVSYVQSRLELLPNLDDGEDLRINSNSEIVAPISSHIGLKSSYRVEYDRQPAPGKKRTDTTLQTGLQISF